jgi:hypothetical protein
MKSRKVAIPIEPSEKPEAIPVEEEKSQPPTEEKNDKAPKQESAPEAQAAPQQEQQKPKKKRQMTDAKMKALEKANKARQEKLFLRKQAQEHC